MCYPRFSLVTLLFLGTSLHAQVTGRLTGTVVDPAGASVPNAKVGLYLPGGNTPLLSTATNSDGIFDFIAVRPDMYLLKVEAAGFNKLTQADVKVDPARQLMLAPIALTLSSASQS